MYNLYMKAKLLLPEDYVKDAQEKINQATDRVYFLAMVIAKDSSSSPLIDSLIEASKRGVDVNVAADTFTYAELAGYFLPMHHRNKKSRATTQMAKDLEKAGVKFDWLGKAKSTIFSGRTHTKMCIVDDYVYCFGGINLYQGGIAANDYMFVQKDKNLADQLIKEYETLRNAEKKSSLYRSHTFSWNDSKVLVDGGIIGDSIIYRRACELVKNCKEVLFVSQYPPSGKLSTLINQRDNKIYFNPPTNASDSVNTWFIKFGQFFSKNQTLYNKRKYLHAKFIVVTNNDGSKIALTGSHNFVYGAVLLGTREIALETSDNDYIVQLLKFFNENIA